MFGATATAQASTVTINGDCGLHIVSQVIPTSDQWNVRIGPRHDNPTGRLRCLGKYAKQSGRTASGGLSWSYHPFGITIFQDVYNWNWHGILATSAQATLSTAACASFGRTFILKLPLTMWTATSTAASSYGCINGWKNVLHKVSGVNHVFTIRGVH
jgi:hypothetical protein